MTLTRLFSSPKGKAPAPWDTTLGTTQTAPSRPVSITREGELLRRLSRQQWITVGLIGVVVALAVNQRYRDSMLQPTCPDYVVEVAERGQIRDVHAIAAQGYQVKEPTMIDVLSRWLLHVRTAGDSRVLLGRAWTDAQKYVAAPLRPWFVQYIRTRDAELTAKRWRVEITEPVIIPIVESKRTYRASWSETTITQGGDQAKPTEQWEATFVLQQAPSATPEERKAWANRLGILIIEVHWHRL